MKANRDSQSHQKQAATAPPKTKDTNMDLLMSPKMLEDLHAVLTPLLDFHKAAEELTMDDVRIHWDVRAIRGSNTAFAHLKGSVTLHQLLSTQMLPDSPHRVEQEMIEKIVIPMVGIVQEESNRMALEIVAADDAARASDDRSDDDLL
jgi:hypothetical protein